MIGGVGRKAGIGVGSGRMVVFDQLTAPVYLIVMGLARAGRVPCQDDGLVIGRLARQVPYRPDLGARAACCGRCDIGIQSDARIVVVDSLEKELIGRLPVQALHKVFRGVARGGVHILPVHRSGHTPACPIMIDRKTGRSAPGQSDGGFALSSGIQASPVTAAATVGGCRNGFGWYAPVAGAVYGHHVVVVGGAGAQVAVSVAAALSFSDPLIVRGRCRYRIRRPPCCPEHYKSDGCCSRRGPRRKASAFQALLDHRGRL